jgi:hypothetical protein
VGQRGIRIFDRDQVNRIAAEVARSGRALSHGAVHSDAVPSTRERRGLACANCATWQCKERDARRALERVGCEVLDAVEEIAAVGSRNQTVLTALERLLAAVRCLHP